VQHRADCTLRQRPHLRVEGRRLLSVTYYLNPKQVSDQARVYPQYEFINPLGLTITEFHENRVSVDVLSPDAVSGAAR